MTVLRIVADFQADDPQTESRFYRELLDLDVVMDQAFIVTLASGETMAPQMSLMTEGGSGAPVPAMSIEVDNIDAVYERAKRLNMEIVYTLTEEPWGVRRFFARDPAGRIINLLQHIG
ncbi:MAG: VOC family protein [Sphingorhabdus sp.]